MVQSISSGKTLDAQTPLPEVSVIIPVRNAQATIEKCIKGLLKQDYPEEKRRIIVVDNGSTDRTLEIIRSFSVECLVEPNTGSYNARNLALKYASGQIVAFTDSDCIPESNWLSKLISGFTTPNVAGCGGKIEDFVGTSWVQQYSNKKVLRQEVSMNKNTRPHPYIIGANMAYRRWIFEELGPFDGRFISGGDTDMSWRTQQAGYQIRYIPQAIVHHFHRATVAGLYGQYFRYGIGRHCLTYKHLKETTDQRYSYPLSRSVLRCHESFSLWLKTIKDEGFISEFSKHAFLDFIRQGAHLSGLLMGKVLYAGKL